MLKPEQVDLESLHYQNPLFTWPNAYGKGLLPLVSEASQVLIGPDSWNEPSSLYVYRLKEGEKAFLNIISYQESLQQKKLSFTQKITLLVRIKEYYPQASFPTLIKDLDFPLQKEALLHFIVSLSYQERENWLAKGVQALRFWEYLFMLREYALYEVIRESASSGQELRQVLTQMFELQQMGILSKNDTVSVSEISQFLLRRRYPEFARMYENFQEKNKRLPSPPFVKVGTMPFFEGKKLLVEMELKNPQQLEESLQFIQNQFSTLREMLSLFS